jgi:hypothetical protein
MLYRLMFLSGEELRRRFEALSDDELHAVIRAQQGTYTDTAREAARQVLEERSNGVRVPSQEPAHEISYAVENALFAPGLGILQWWRGLLPDHIPPRIRKLFAIGLVAMSPAVPVAIAAAFEYLNHRNLDRTYRYLSSGRGGYVCSLALAGLCLAYGIKTERRYAQYLAVVVIVLSTAAAILDGFLSHEISTGMYAVGATAFGMCRYLFRDPEATTYYRNIRARGFRVMPAASATLYTGINEVPDGRREPRLG